MNGHAIREAARGIALVVHDGQCRKGAGEPYFNHVEAVADGVWGWRQKSIAFLHDVIEDCEDPATMTHALSVIFPLDIVESVLKLSRLSDKNGEKVPYEEFIQNIADTKDEDIIRVKIADVRHNLKDIRDIPGAQGMEVRYLKALATLEEALDGLA